MGCMVLNGPCKYVSRGFEGEKRGVGQADGGCLGQLAMFTSPRSFGSCLECGELASSAGRGREQREISHNYTKIT